MQSRRPRPRELGARLAQMLYRAWDPDHVSEVPAELDERVMTLLLGGGAGGLAYHPMRGSDPELFPLAARLRLRHRLELMQARLRERCLVDTVTMLRLAGVEPLLIKGWAIARLYPDPGMRPYGDLDLCVRDEDYGRAVESLRKQVGAQAPVELHRASDRQGDLQYGTLFSRSRLLPLNGVEIRAPSDERHLRLLALHMLAHGAWRPQWLCDLAVAVESRSPEFDWELCLQGDRRLSEWVLVTLILAHQLLGARLDDTPANNSTVRLPPWVIHDVLETWGRGRGANMDASPGAHLVQGGLLAFVGAVRSNWRNGVQASFELRAPANSFPRLPFRIAASFARLTPTLRAALLHRKRLNSS